jgi:hypothetical protein
VSLSLMMNKNESFRRMLSHISLSEWMVNSRYAEVACYDQLI